MSDRSRSPAGANTSDTARRADATTAPTPRNTPLSRLSRLRRDNRIAAAAATAAANANATAAAATAALNWVCDAITLLRVDTERELSLAERLAYAVTRDVNNAAELVRMANDRVPRDGPATAARQLRLLLDSYRFEKRSGVFKTYGFIATELSRTTVLGQSWGGGASGLTNLRNKMNISKLKLFSKIQSRIFENSKFQSGLTS